MATDLVTLTPPTVLLKKKRKEKKKLTPPTRLQFLNGNLLISFIGRKKLMVLTASE